MFIQRAFVSRVERGQRVRQDHLFVIVVDHRQLKTKSAIIR
jgi:hypothetical protein